MTTRGFFIGGATAALAATAAGVNADPLAAGDKLTQAALFASLPRPSGRMWSRLIMGSGAIYQKQIGLGSEAGAGGITRLFYEIEVGSPGGSCNPNTLRKAYLQGSRYGSLIDIYPLVASVGRASNLVFRYGDVASKSPPSPVDSKLRLLDVPALFDPRPMTVRSISYERRHQANRGVDTTHVVGDYASSHVRGQKLRRIELWHAAGFPFGVVRYRATFDGLDPFELETYAFGNDYTTGLPLSLDKVRLLTKDDQYGFIPND